MSREFSTLVRFSSPKKKPQITLVNQTSIESLIRLCFFPQFGSFFGWEIIKRRRCCERNFFWRLITVKLKTFFLSLFPWILARRRLHFWSHPMNSFLSLFFFVLFSHKSNFNYVLFLFLSTRKLVNLTLYVFSRIIN